MLKELRPGQLVPVEYGAGEAEQIAVLIVPTSSDNETGIRCEMGTEMLREMTAL